MIMVTITMRCYKCHALMKAVDVEILDDGVLVTLECGHKMRKFWKQER